jgi:hypothetical protein
MQKAQMDRYPAVFDDGPDEWDVDHANTSREISQFGSLSDKLHKFNSVGPYSTEPKSYKSVSANPNLTKRQQQVQKTHEGDLRSQSQSEYYQPRWRAVGADKDLIE